MAADSIHDELFELCPEEDPGYPLIPRSKKQKGACNYDPEPVDQPPNPPPGPAPEESNEEDVCVQAPDGPRVKVYPQLAQYDTLSSPAQHCGLIVKNPVRQQVPRLQTPASTKVNLYCTTIIWCLLFILLWNPFALICYIPALYFGLKAAKEERNSDRALRYQRMEKRFKCGMYFWIIMYILIPPMVLYAIVSKNAHVRII